MYNSVKDWMDVPFTIKQFDKITGSGAKLYEAPVDKFCYPAGEIKRIQNDFGEEVVSGTQLYVDGDTLVTTHDLVFFEGREWNIQSVKTFYRDRVPDLKVVYL